MSTSAKGRPAGVLPINAAATKKASATSAASKSTTRSPVARLRLIIRRLPPGLTESEFWATLGEEWQVNTGKVDWAVFREGKVSRDPAKPSRPARAYLKVKEQNSLDLLAAKIKQSTFQDARNTTKDSCLLGPPSLEFAPFNRTPSSRVRHDGRQGTIDQDQEFIDFLQSLTEPIAKPAMNGAETAEGRPEKITTTPLVQYIKEKKANKAKEPPQSKGSKGRQDGKDTKTPKESRSTVVVRGTTPAAEKARVAKATQDAVKAINRSVASMQGKSTPTKTDTKPVAAEEIAQTPPAKRERDRGNASAAARMLQRDLGLVGKPPRTPRSASTTQPAVIKSETTPASPAPPAQEVKPTLAATPTPPSGPRTTRTPSAAPAKATPPTQRASKPLPQPSAGAKSAFLKHANPSQGVTEDLLRTTFQEFGSIARCEIDKKKGLGYVDFDDTEALRKAMHASPIKIGNGQVVVLENRNAKRAIPRQPSQAQAAATATATNIGNISATKSPAPGTSSTVSATTSAVSSPAPVPATPVAPAAPAAVTSTPSQPTGPASTPTSATPSTSTPTAPRSAARGGNNPGRGARGNYGPKRGNFAPANRGGARGGFRGGRASFGPSGNRGGRGGGGGAAAAGTDTATPTATGEGGAIADANHSSAGESKIGAEQA